jgi:dipeptidyl aminopeptidase/acylaminoacyl peptidase
MPRDLRDTPLYREMEEHFRRTLEPGFGRVTAAADLDVAPDGRRVAFTGGRLDALEGAPSGRVCVLDLETGAFDEVTHGPNDDQGPRWSPDGLRIAFLSDREGPGRIRPYLLEAGRVGEAVPLPEVEGTVERLAWSPDGSRLLLCAAGLGADQAGAAGSGSTGKAGELPSWIPALEGGDATDEWRRLWVLDLNTRALRRVSAEKTNVWEAAWCGPDAVVAIVSEAPEEDAWYDATLVAIDLGTGEERELVRSAVQLGVPAANADGSRVAVVEALCSDRTIVAGTLLLCDLASGEVAPIDTGAVDVSDLAWIDRDQCFVSGLRGMESVFGVVDAAEGSFAERWSTTDGSGAWFPAGRPLGADGFVTVLEGLDHPHAVTVIRDRTPSAVITFATRALSTWRPPSVAPSASRGRPPTAWRSRDCSCSPRARGRTPSS